MPDSFIEYALLGENTNSNSSNSKQHDNPSERANINTASTSKVELVADNSASSDTKLDDSVAEEVVSSDTARQKAA